MFTGYDMLAILLYFVAVLSIGFSQTRRSEENTLDFFLAGRSMSWGMIGISIFATNISSEHFIGLAGAGASRGLAVGQFELLAILLLVFLAWILVPVYFKSGIITVPEFLERRFDPTIRKIYSGMSVAIYLFTKILVSLFAAGLLFNSIFGLNIYTSSIIIVLITGIYSTVGGAQAVMRTQVFQGVLLILGAVILSIFGLNAVGGYSVLQEKLPEEFFSIFKPATDPEYPWTGIIFGAPIIAFWYWCTDQYIIQRILSARSVGDARRGTLLAALLKVLPIFILVLPGLFAAVLYPNIKGDEAYSALIAGNLLPPGVKGIVVAGLLAAIMSSLAGAFNTTAAIYTHDYYRPLHPEVSERKLVLIGRLSTIAVVVLTIFIVPLVRLITSQLYLFLQSIQSFISPPIAAVFLFALFSKKINSRTAIFALVLGEAIGLFRLVLQLMKSLGTQLPPVLEGIVAINFLHFAIILFVFSVSVILLMNIAAEPSSRKIVAQTNQIILESFGELRRGLLSLKAAKRLFMSILFSVFIKELLISILSIR